MITNVYLLQNSRDFPMKIIEIPRCRVIYSGPGSTIEYLKTEIRNEIPKIV